MKLSRRRIWVVALVLAAAAGGTAFFWPRQKPVTVIAARIEHLPELRQVVNGSGEIRTENMVDIQAEIAGVIVDLPIREGDTVAKGQVLLRIDPVQTEADVLVSRSQVASMDAEVAGQNAQIAASQANALRDQFLKKTAELELRQAEVNQARAQEAYQREQRLLEEKLTSTDQFEIVESQLRVNQAQVEAAKARIEQYEAQIGASRAAMDFAVTVREAYQQRAQASRSTLHRMEDLLKKTTISSPIPGVVVKLNVEIGERAVPGNLSSPQATLMVIADLSVIEAELRIDETDIVNIRQDQIGKVVVDALPDTPLVGRVIEIGNSPINSSSMSQSSSSSQEGKDFKVVLRIDNPPTVLRPGMSCDADIVTEIRKNVLVVPIQALTMRDLRVDAAGNILPKKPEEERGGRTATAQAESEPERRKELQGVFVCTPDGKAAFRPIKTGITGEADAEVLSGLAEGDEVVAGPLKALRTIEDGTAIRVDREKPYKRILGRKRVEEAEEKKDS